jgi:hypothetical protein
MKKRNLSTLGIYIKPTYLPSESKIHDNPYVKGPINIIGGLYLGSEDTARDPRILLQYGIEAIINVAKECSIDPPFDTFNQIQFEWTHDEDISQTIDRAIDLILYYQEKEMPILIHCHQGLSRSAALVIGYIMKSKGLSCSKAYEFVKKRAPQISPNILLISHLYQCEKKWSLSQ